MLRSKAVVGHRTKIEVNASSLRRRDQPFSGFFTGPKLTFFYSRFLSALHTPGVTHTDGEGKEICTGKQIFCGHSGTT